MMRTLKLTIAYDGTRYAGWQAQRPRRQQARQPTIQATLEQALRQVLQEPVKVIGSGRTDAGVHALAQVAHVRTRSSRPVTRLLRSMNQLLPDDVAVLAIKDVGSDFHARFNARHKHYRYRVFTGPVVSPFVRPFVHQVSRPLHLAIMRREAAALQGRHDFKAFMRAASLRGSTIRTLHRVQLIRRAQELHFEFVGNGFLHTMVRSMVGTLLDVGRGRLPAGTIRQMLAVGRRDLAGTTAPAQGLALISVSYGDPHG